MTVMPKYFGVVRTPDGRVVSGAQISVFNTATAVYASIYEDDNTTPLPNPLTSDQNGQFSFSANSGAYDIYVRVSTYQIYAYLQTTMGSPGGSGAVDSVNTRTGDVVLNGGDIPTFVAAGASHAAGAVPDPGGTALPNAFLCADATFKAIPNFIGGAGSQSGAVPDPGAGATGVRALFDNGTWLNPYAFASLYGYSLILEQQTQGTNAGTFTTGSWITRTLNVLATDTTGNVILATNQITLPAGSYLFFISCPAFSTEGHIAQLLNITDGIVCGTSTSEYAGSNNQSRCFIQCRVTIATGLTKQFEVQHRCNLTQSTNGLGAATNLATETYTTVLILTEPEINPP